MAVIDTTYYGLTRVRDQSPEARDWATVDTNWDVITRIVKSLELHAHTGVAAIRYPGYDVTAPTLPILTEVATDGFLSPGTTVGVRLAYVHDNGLETEASPEVSIELAAAAPRALTPLLTSVDAEADTIPGGSYLYGITKGKGSGETPISDLLPVEIPYDQTYKVALEFEAISTYTDVEFINIYRSEGMDSAFALVASITDTSTTTFVDDNSAVDLSVQPPQQNTFDATRSVTIDWSAITHPDDAKTLRIYVTRETHLWGSNHTLLSQDLTTGTPPTSYAFTGTEVLSPGWPKDSSQLTSTPPKVNLDAEVTGALKFDANYDADGHYIKNLSLAQTPTITKIDGMIWYDPTTDNFMGHSDGDDFVLGSPDDTYVHPAEATGGHIAANIKHHASSSNSAKDVLDYISDSSTGGRKQVQTVQQIYGTTGQFSSTAPSLTDLPGLIMSFTPDFANQWLEVTFDCNYFISNSEGLAYFDFKIYITDSSDEPVVDVTNDEWVRTYQGFKSPTFGTQGTATLTLDYQMANTTYHYYVVPRFAVSVGSIVFLNNRRKLVGKKVF